MCELISLSMVFFLSFSFGIDHPLFLNFIMQGVSVNNIIQGLVLQGNILKTPAHSFPAHMDQITLS